MLPDDQPIAEVAKRGGPEKRAKVTLTPDAGLA